ncbi:MAG: M50 family metallopeptidase [Actinomycetota bacterium]|jgi:regulator of sigma E protease|nr:M50 family metallopeptidase [Actinomycetota bacterium]
MNIALQYIYALLAFSLIIIVHELGHFVLAKINKVHVEEFFIGMGPKLLKFKSKSGTLWGLSAIPVGGYNKISGMTREEEVPKGKEEKVFYKKPYWSKLLIIIGGAFFNVLFAFVLIFIFFSMGTYSATNKVDYIQESSPAYTFGIKKYDEIIGINDVEVNNWEEFAENIKKYPGEKINLKIIRDNKQLEIEVTLEEKEGEGYLGISPTTEKQIPGFFQSLKESLIFIGDFFISFFKLLGMLFTGQLGFEEARPVSPIGLVSIFQQSASMGLQYFIMIIALVSLLLGFSNIIPLLPLDGGHIIVLTIEAIKKKPLSKKAIQIYNSIGIVIFISLFLVGIVFDILKPINIMNM